MRNVLSQFDKHVSDVDRLISFDQDVMSVAINSVEELHNRLVKQGMQNDQWNGGRTLKILKDIRNNESLKPRFSLILNQAIVLLVSYFASAVEDIFCKSVNASLRKETMSQLMKSEVKISITELLEVAENPAEAVAQLIINNKDLSFQDMQSIQRAFGDYVGVVIEKNNIVNNIILSHACRHVIVHAGGEINQRLLRQISNATPRDIKPKIENSGLIHFSQGEVKQVAESMKTYLTLLVGNIETVLEAIK